MYQNIQNTTQVVRIDTVDVANNSIHCTSKDGGHFILKIPISNGFYRIPKAGENWIVRREDLTNWYFEGVVVPTGLYGSSYPQEGDVVIDAINNLNINAKHVFINSLPIGIPAHQEFVLEEQTGQIELEYVPLTETLMVFNNGLLIAPSGIIIREQVLLFNESLSVGKVVVYYTRVPE